MFMRRMRLFTGGGVIMLTLAAPTLVAAGQTENDPVLGHWNLVVERSIYDPGPPPRSQRRSYELHPDGVRTTIVTYDPAGQRSQVIYIAAYDAMEYPLVGTTNADALALVRLDPLLAEGTVSHAGSPVAYARRVISDDGQLMTITVRQVTSGAVNVAVYEREPE